MEVVVNAETREFMTSHFEPDDLKDHHEVVTVDDVEFNKAFDDAVGMGPAHTIDIFPDGRISIRKKDIADPASDLRAFLSKDSPEAEDVVQAIRGIIRYLGITDA